jgi:hypothetical protein
MATVVDTVYDFLTIYQLSMHAAFICSLVYYGRYDASA